LFATAASHLAVTAWGSQPAYPDRARIEALLPELARGARVL
jgi:ribokinase